MGRSRQQVGCTGWPWPQPAHRVGGSAGPCPAASRAPAGLQPEGGLQGSLSFLGLRVAHTQAFLSGILPPTSLSVHASLGCGAGRLASLGHHPGQPALGHQPLAPLATRQPAPRPRRLQPAHREETHHTELPHAGLRVVGWDLTPPAKGRACAVAQEAAGAKNSPSTSGRPPESLWPRAACQGQSGLPRLHPSQLHLTSP